MKRLVCWFALIFLSCSIKTDALADSPSLKKTKYENSFAFGDIRIRQSFDSTKDPMDPEFKLQVYDKDQLILQLRDAAFDAFYSSPNGKAFVGLSNSGWPGTAVIIFDRRGRILLLAEHGFAKFDYCGETPTFIKEWYDSKSPQVLFPAAKFSGKKIPGITLRDCRGQTIDLLDAVTKASENSGSELRLQINVLYGTR
jgi:hypothetical protein